MKKFLITILAVVLAVGTFATTFNTNARRAYPNENQIVENGGYNQSADGSVQVSKTITGSFIENVFDITLSIQCKQGIAEFEAKPDMAVIIVMDCSNSMNTAMTGGITRAQASIVAAQDFVENFKDSTSSTSKVGLVTFNTNSYESVSLSLCNDTTQATDIKTTIATTVTGIVDAENYAYSHDRFTNIEAGIKRATDLLASATNENKYIIFLSDGFPTTYIQTGYTGWDPYCSTGDPGTDGVFYDSVEFKYCIYGCSYSDKAAIKARQAATAAKNAGISIFSIGVAVEDETIDKYVVADDANSYAIVDREDVPDYEIGNGNSAEVYKNWLKNSIGSGYYYNSTDAAGLMSAYQQIFAEIIKASSASLSTLWTTTDPIPVTDNIEFIAFYDKDGENLVDELKGSAAENAENTASFNATTNTINWNLRKSGYSVITGSTYNYLYVLRYRIRLANENINFAENVSIKTNGETTLKYQYFVSEGGVVVMKSSSVSFEKIPEIKGYLVDFTFKKLGKYTNQTDEEATALPGAKFVLSHDEDNCPACNDETNEASTIEDFEATSDSEGNVTFTNVPSGHTYILTETTVPEKYYENGDKYSVEVGYDEIIITITHSDETTTVVEEGFESIINLQSPAATPTPTPVPTEEPTAEPTTEPTTEPTEEPTEAPEDPPKETSDNAATYIVLLTLIGAIIGFTIVLKKKDENA